MTFRQRSLGPPSHLFGVVRWFARNFLEAVIWASAGAAVLVLLLAIHNYPWAAMWTLNAVTIVATLFWFARRTGMTTPIPPHANVLQFAIFRVVIQIFVETRHGPTR